MYLKHFSDIITSEIPEKHFSNSDLAELLSFITSESYESVFNRQKSDGEPSAESIKSLVQSLSDSVPLEYITNRSHFYGLNLYVDQRVLIPRPETEILVSQVSEYMRQKKGFFNVLEVGVGSGAIPLGLASELSVSAGSSTDIDFNYVGVDVSFSALEVAGVNVETHNLSDKIQLVQMDALESLPEGVFDIVICNPPYINEWEYLQLERSLYYEPKTALVPKSGDGLDHYKNLLRRLPTCCKIKSCIFFEIGVGISRDLYFLMDNCQYLTYKVVKDYSGIDRVVVADFIGLTKG